MESNKPGLTVEKTPYEWCLDLNIRVVDVNTWPDEMNGSSEKCYFEYLYSAEDFKAALTKVSEVKPNSTPRKTESYLEYRMYGLVPYNISSIQGAIQYGHALQEYNNMMIGLREDSYRNVYDKSPLLVAFDKWRKKDKTFIILNGGTTNDNRDSKWYGSLQQYRDLLIEKYIFFAHFKEPDLNNALSAIVFLVDERVFNRELYKDFEPTPMPWAHKGKNYTPNESELKKWNEENDRNYKNWVDKVGGESNAFLRETLKKFKLAS
jgi:hypothetical protein